MKKLLCSLAVVVALACTTSAVAQDGNQKKEAAKTESCCKSKEAKCKDSKKADKKGCCDSKKAECKDAKKAEKKSCCKSK